MIPERPVAGAVGVFEQSEGTCTVGCSGPVPAEPLPSSSADWRPFALLAVVDPLRPDLLHPHPSFLQCTTSQSFYTRNHNQCRVKIQNQNALAPQIATPSPLYFGNIHGKVGVRPVNVSDSRVITYNVNSWPKTERGIKGKELKRNLAFSEAVWLLPGTAGLLELSPFWHLGASGREQPPARTWRSVAPLCTAAQLLQLHIHVHNCTYAECQ